MVMGPRYHILIAAFAGLSAVVVLSLFWIFDSDDLDISADLQEAIPSRAEVELSAPAKLLDDEREVAEQNRDHRAEGVKNVDTALTLMGGHSQHDLALLSDIERLGQADVMDAVRTMFWLRDENASQDAIRDHADYHFSNPPHLHLAARRWIAAEFRTEDTPEPRGHSEGRGSGIKRFRKLDR